MQGGHGLPPPAPGPGAAPANTSQPSCHICGRPFDRTQERNRHLRSFLPHWIFCAFSQCPYRCDRHDNLVAHWEKEHSHANGGQAPQQLEEYQIYDSNELVAQVISGHITMEDAITDALSEVEQRAQELGKRGVWEGNLWGRRCQRAHVFEQ